MVLLDNLRSGQSLEPEIDYVDHRFNSNLESLPKNENKTSQTSIIGGKIRSVATVAQAVTSVTIQEYMRSWHR